MVILNPKLGLMAFLLQFGSHWPMRLVCAMRSLAIVIINFRSFVVVFFPPSFAFDPLWGISRVSKFVSPNIFTASVRSRPPGPPAVPEVFENLPPKNVPYKFQIFYFSDLYGK